MAAEEEFVDWYAFVGVERDAPAREISRAYRKRALSCHPDKRPGDAAAAKEFATLQRAYDVLSDEAARKAFDGVLEARELRERRRDAEDGRRRKQREDLEAREAAARAAQRAAYGGGAAPAPKRARAAEADEDGPEDARASLAAETAARKQLEAELQRIRDRNAAAAAARARASASAARAGASGGSSDDGAALTLRWAAGTAYSAELLQALVRSVCPPRGPSAPPLSGPRFTVVPSPSGRPQVRCVRRARPPPLVCPAPLPSPFLCRSSLALADCPPRPRRPRTSGQALVHFAVRADASAVAALWRGGGGLDEDLEASTGIRAELSGADGGGTGRRPDGGATGASASAAGADGGAAPGDGSVGASARGTAAPELWTAGGSELGLDELVHCTEYERVTLLRLRRAAERQQQERRAAAMPAAP